MAQALSGLFNLDKPTGITSRRAVDLVARHFRKTKVGHAGTLDPLATGVLVVCVGSATRLIEQIQKMPKTYRTVIRLGARSETLDAHGTIVEVESPTVPTRGEVEAAVATQRGTISQLPPEFSALRVNGQRAYDLARRGETVALLPRAVRIDRIDIRFYEWPRLELEIDCGGGTYIRSIARDVGEILGCGGLVEALVRTRIGPFHQGDAIDPTAITPETLATWLRPTLEAAAGLPQYSLSAEEVVAIRQGKSIGARAGLERTDEAARNGTTHDPVLSGAEGEVALIGPDGDLIAIGASATAGRIQPRRVL